MALGDGELLLWVLGLNLKTLGALSCPPDACAWPLLCYLCSA